MSSQQNDTNKDIWETIWTDTTKLVVVWEKDISNAISWAKTLHKDQIPESFKKREENIAKERSKS